ncbi:hypothetical protein EDC56_1113 [Sinobacterium caligoides]|uniref:Uncharacterized protein n=1 Tax=Sinobacterium caligoides TaxID=933926 RepID=A0A3N2E0F3_9GAMM|nr:hypothetical protein [Sinobacterium caligoides]ROS05576.1 hypothetical protein EDC56_1113 [Sinobacterium caligoides]
MIDWVVTESSNRMDIKLGFARVLEEMRAYVRTTLAGTVTINIYHETYGQEPKTSLTMSANNFEISHINGQVIHYNYVGLPTFYATDLPGSFPTGGAPANPVQKAKLLYLLPEAARSSVLEEKFTEELMRYDGAGSVTLSDYTCLVNNYSHTCHSVGLNLASLARPLTAIDYRTYAATLAEGTPDKLAIAARC